MPKHSAGLLLFRRAESGWQVLLAHPGGPSWARKDKGAWSIPKGELAEDEDPLQGALREFAEETGHHVTGEFIALDMDTGKTLWQFQTSSGINAQPITFTHKGRQYVAIQSGLGGVNVVRMGEQLKNVPRGGSMWVFALMDQ